MKDLKKSVCPICRSFPAIKRWAVDEMGKNSVIPSTKPSIIVFNIVIIKNQKSSFIIANFHYHCLFLADII